ncbi:hypothetical protein ABH20_12490 [Geobacillus sp. T6]|nr:hypothetical protein ABH20_12490 [Geobacillus sp. T6]
MVVVYDALGAPVVIHQGQDQSLKIKWKEIRLDENKMNKDGLQDNRNTSQPNVTQLQTETGYISWYDGEGKKGAAGVVLNGKSAAHKTIDFYTKVKTTSLENGKSTIVEILDRGPYIQGRILDMVETAFSNIHNTRKGLFKGRIQWPIQN